jgi:hypothetical protein
MSHEYRGFGIDTAVHLRNKHKRNNVVEKLSEGTAQRLHAYLHGECCTHGVVVGLRCVGCAEVTGITGTLAYPDPTLEALVT